MGDSRLTEQAENSFTTRMFELHEKPETGSVAVIVPGSSVAVSCGVNAMPDGEVLGTMSDQNRLLDHSMLGQEIFDMTVLSISWLEIVKFSVKFEEVRFVTAWLKFVRVKLKQETEKLTGIFERRTADSGVMEHVLFVERITRALLGNIEGFPATSTAIA